MKDVIPVLEKLGYGEIRPEGGTPGAGEWLPLSDVNGRYGTTGELVATARKSCPLDTAPNE